MLALSHPLGELDWIPRPRLTALKRLGLLTVGDLLTHYPRRHEDRREFPSFPRDESDQPVCVCGEVVNTSVRRFGGWKKIFEATLQEEEANALSQPLILRWFNLHYVQKMIATGQRLVVFGKPRRRGQRLCLEHPEFEIIEEDDEISVHFRRITPIHPATEGLSQRALRSLIHRLLEELDPADVTELLPPALRVGDRLRALHEIHFPTNAESLAEARTQLVLTEFFALQLTIAHRRAEMVRRTGIAHAGDGRLVEKFLQALPFQLTGAQARVLEEVKRDLASSFPMNRLLQGDVGSGKTVVAVAAMLAAVEAGSRAALMAPTQILAEQHYGVIGRWLEPLGLRVGLRTGARQEETGAMPLFGGANAEDGLPQIVIGTHALLQEGVPLERLGLVVIDEQHKFGVAQRARLTAREPAPDVLVMTATPIPRTLTMTLYGDLDISVVDEMPAERGRLRTAVRKREKLPEVLTFLRRELEAGRQAYVVHALIDESQKLSARAAAAEYATWCERIQPFHCELLHGRVAPAEKEAIMERFRRGETHLLISTTVIEVGVDVPNATIMIIEDADRFGLSQLHQLRGRIGRGRHDSYCILLSDAVEEEAVGKLGVLEKTRDGFAIAEADWDLRGPGDLLGTAQSGLPGLKLGDLRRDADLMRKARAAAVLLTEKDPRLERVENQHFRRLVVEETGRAFADVG